MAAEGGKAANSVHLGACALLFASAFALYALTASPAIGWLDSPEFVAQSLSLGVAHSPGHPLVGMLGYLASMLPLGDSVWRINLMSSLCAAGAVTLLFLCLHQIFVRIAGRVGPQSSLAIALAIAATAGCSYALWSNAVRAEVYALQALLSAGALFALLRFDASERARDLLLASLLLSLGLANHHLMAILLLVPGAAFALWRASRPGLRLAMQCAAIGLLGLCALLYLPLRSLARPLVNFGAPHTLERFFWTLRGAAFSKSLGDDHASTPLVDAIQITSALVDALSLPLFLLALFGLYCGVRDRATRRALLFLVAILALTVGARVALGFDPETPDHHAYLLPAMFSLWLGAAAGMAQLCRLALAATRPLPKAPAIAAVALSLLIPIQLTGQWQRSSQAASWGSDDLAHWSLEALPPNSLVLSAYFQTRFRLWALRAVEGSRPDISVLDRSFLSYPGMAEQATAAHPELAALIASPLRAGYETPVPLLRAIAGKRPVFAELHPNVDRALAATLSPSGAFARAFASGSERRRDRLARDALARRLQAAGSGEREHARGALLWHDAMRLDQYCALGDRTSAASVYADALALAPHDQLLDAIAKACQL